MNQRKKHCQYDKFYFAFTKSNTDGGWASWSKWSDCDVTCGMGMRMRARTCDNPVPRNNGIDCVGQVYETKPCSFDECPG